MQSIRNVIIPASVALGLAIGSTAGSAVNAQDLSNMSDSERDVFRDEVRAYLLDNPEILMEAFAVLETRQAAQQTALDSDLVKVNAAELFEDGYSYVMGNPEGDITIVEFLDYRCGYCRKAYQVMNEILANDPNIKLILKEYPILSEESMLSARFALSAQRQFGAEAYEKVHHALISFRGQVTPDSLRVMGDNLGLDGTAIVDGMNATEIDLILTKNRSLGQRMQISGTPAFVVQDQLERGYLPYEPMAQLIEEIRTSAVN